jgi:GT2 family glycosyltransferase
VQALRNNITSNPNPDFTFEEIRKYDPPDIIFYQQLGNLGFSKSF